MSSTGRHRRRFTVDRTACAALGAATGVLLTVLLLGDRTVISSSAAPPAPAPYVLTERDRELTPSMLMIFNELNDRGVRVNAENDAAIIDTLYRGCSEPQSVNRELSADISDILNLICPRTP